MPTPTDVVLVEVELERARQDLKWGEQNHEPCYWLGILGEEYGEVCKAAIEFPLLPNAAKLKELRTELVQVAAVAVSFVEYIDRNGEELLS